MAAETKMVMKQWYDLHAHVMFMYIPMYISMNIHMYMWQIIMIIMCAS